jgi:ATP-dependent RNA helicase RhlE
MNHKNGRGRKETEVRFSELGLAKNLLARVDSFGFEFATPIQHQVIPTALTGKDVVGIAQTGTGKTLGFGLPLIQSIGLNKGHGLVLLPTRELALQVNETLDKIARPLGLRTAVLIGGASISPQTRQLKNRPHVVVATPGRLQDHLKQKNYTLNNVSVLVLDEADRMLDIGFSKEITQIMQDTPKDKQTMLFSATMPDSIGKLAARYMKTPFRVEVAPQGTSAKNIEQEIFFVEKGTKLQLLEKILIDNTGTALIFSRTKHGAKKIARSIRAMGVTAAEIHSNRSQNQRQFALSGFKSGKFRVLVATDIAARGIDVQEIGMVINYDLPDNSEDYVHRIGRTGRAGHYGKAISFAEHSQKGDVRSIERLIRKTLPVLDLPKDLPARRAIPRREPQTSGNSRGYKGRRPGGGGNFNRSRSGGGRSGGGRRQGGRGRRR